MKALLFRAHTGFSPPRNEVVAIEKTGNDLDVLLDEEEQKDPDTQFWVEDIPSESVPGSSFYPSGYDPHNGQMKPEWVHK